MYIFNSLLSSICIAIMKNGNLPRDGVRPPILELTIRFHNSNTRYVRLPPLHQQISLMVMHIHTHILCGCLKLCLKHSYCATSFK